MPAALRLPRRLQLLLVLTLPSLLLSIASVCVYKTYRIEPPQRLSPEARTAVIATLRAALVEQPEVPADHPELSRRLEDGGPVIVSVHRSGRTVFGARGEGDTVAQAVNAAAADLRARATAGKMSLGARRLARIKIDIVSGRAAFASGNQLSAMLGMHPGIDGIGVELDGEPDVLILPDELVDQRLLYAEQPLSFIPDLNLGFDFRSADLVLAVRAGLGPGEYGPASKRYFRFRTDAFVEQPLSERDKPPIALTRGFGPRPELTIENLHAAAISGARYLVAHMADTGRYIYETNLATGRSTNPKQRHPYSLPRHAGTTYFLAEIFRITGEEFLREPIERAFAHLSELLSEGSCDGVLGNGAEFACVADKGQKVAGLGSTALTVVALAEYKRATGSDKYDALTKKFAEWILYMQRDDGSFRHLYDTEARRPNEDAQLLYYSGEAALALARMHTVFKEERYKVAAEKALDNLMDWYDFFVGAFFYGEEHWTCIAAEAIYPAVKKERYRTFCDGYGKFLGAQQPLVGDFPDQTDLAGTYGFTPFMIPNNTPAGSRTEATISSYLLGRYHGKPNPELRAQILRAMHFTLGQQITTDHNFAVSVKAKGMGGIAGSPVDRVVRIDYVQHICSAMIRTAEMMRSDGAPPAN